jgi:hypothetical protein
MWDRVLDYMEDNNGSTGQNPKQYGGCGRRSLSSRLLFSSACKPHIMYTIKKTTQNTPE